MRAISLLFHDVYVDHPDESGFTSEAANRYKMRLSDFDAQLAGVNAVRSDAPVMASAMCRLGDDASPQGAAPFLFTVDDGGSAFHTCIAGRLERLGWRGHCFVTTDCIGRRGFLQRQQIRELAERGHIIGSHSASHPPRFNALSFAQMVAQWSRSRAVLEEIVGRRVDIGSVPGGSFSPAVGRAAREAGLRLLFTSEPVTRVYEDDGLLVAGRFTIRRGNPHDRARRLVSARPWTRSLEWASWNAKGLVKPVLGPSYVRLADWLLAAGPSSRASS
jgi:peptidoglycan/xylan/chitin deacetylase (PgdA/CDA1 family)